MIFILSFHQLLSCPKLKLNFMKDEYRSSCGCHNQEKSANQIKQRIKLILNSPEINKFGVNQNKKNTHIQLYNYVY